MTNGVLSVVGKKKTLQVKFTNAKGKEVVIQIADSELSLELTELKRTAVHKLVDLAVELEEIKGQPTQVREQGKVWHPSRSSPTARTTTQQTQQQNTSMGDFHNPYNFVPAPPRKTDDPDLGDIGNLPLPGHGCYHLDRWSGRISVKLKTITPLLIPDAAKLQEDSKGHKTYPIRVDVEGKPYLPATSIKGMLRSAYEAITNSRFSVFEKHGDRLAYRMSAKVGPIPARVELQGENLFLRIMEEPNLLGHAGKLLRYEVGNILSDKGEFKVATRFEVSNDLPQNGEPVWVILNQGIVERIKPWTLSPPDNHGWQKGWVYITGGNIGGKKYERIFIEKEDNEVIPVTDTIKNLWKELILNYQEAHKKDLEKRKKDNFKPEAYLGSEPGKTGWSYHIFTPNAAELKEGTLCYVEFKEAQIEALIPVSISRRLYKIPPHELLDKSLQTAKAITELSPADRVFGWVNQKGKGAYKGHLRVSKVQCHLDSEDPNEGIESFSQGLPLAILGQPKPEQARFYVAKNKQGEPLDNGSAKEKAYQIGNGLRGRKVYPHHKLPADYWEEPMEDRTQVPLEEKYFQEYRRPHEVQYRRVRRNNRTEKHIQARADGTFELNLQKEQKDDQNRSIEGWVKPNLEFTFNINISNLSDVELGGLLWLLSLPDNHYHRLGGGKPLGFGSVQLAINLEQTDLRKGEDWKNFYSSLDEVNHQIYDVAIKENIGTFKKAVVEAYGKENNTTDFQKISFIQAFCRCAEGFEDGKPIHYPRTSQHPHPEGKAFEWFVENESKNGKKRSLPKLIADNGLPYSP